MATGTRQIEAKKKKQNRRWNVDQGENRGRASPARFLARWQQDLSISDLKLAAE